MKLNQKKKLTVTAIEESNYGTKRPPSNTEQQSIEI
jgi:hypothetical protein